MKLTKDQVNHVANLANLKLTTEETSKFQEQLSSVLDYVVKLNEVNTIDVPPTAQTTGLKSVTREDRTGERTLEQEEVTRNAKESKEGYVKTKRVL